MKLAYIDSCVWISWIEGSSEYKKTVNRAMRELAEENWTYCISDATILEVLTPTLSGTRMPPWLTLTSGYSSIAET